MHPIDFDKLIKEAEVHFSRSGGHGGQNVNKVETKVELSFNIEQSKELDAETKELLTQRLAHKIDKHGNIHVSSSEERYQHANRLHAEKKLTLLIQEALEPIKERKATKPDSQSRAKRITSKKKRSFVKKMRRKDFDHD